MVHNSDELAGHGHLLLPNREVWTGHLLSSLAFGLPNDISRGFNCLQLIQSSLNALIEFFIETRKLHMLHFPNPISIAVHGVGDSFISSDNATPDSLAVQ